MNKNPFLPHASYSHQPPLPPGPPPQQGQQVDYSAYWAAAAAAQQPQQHPAVPAYNQPWTAPQPVARPGEQHALYANYGYGNQQNNQWQRPPHQQPYAQPPPPAAQPPPPQAAQAGYAPFQPNTTYHQPYVPIPQPQPIPVPLPYSAPPPPPQPQPQPYMQRPPGAMQQHPQQPMSQPNHHNQQQHPAKRQRFDSPVHNQPMGMRQPQGPPGQFQPPSGPSAHLGRGGSIPSGPSGRGGRGGGSMAGIGRGVPLGPARGGLNNRGGRGGGQFQGSLGGRNGGGNLRGQGSRGNLSGGNRDQSRRLGGSGGSFSKSSGGSFSHNRGRNQGNNPGRTVRQDNSNSSLGGTTTASFSKKEENKRTLTDFKLVGLGLQQIGWSWGTVPDQAGNGDEGLKLEPHDGADASSSQGTVGNDTGEAEVGIKPEPLSQETVPPSAPSSPAKAAGPAKEPSAPSRLRIYFHTPVSHDDAHPIPHMGDVPSDSRKGKRKKLDDDDMELDERRTRPPPQPTRGEDRDGSVAPSVATEVASEGDWLMAAITEGEGGHERGHDDDDEEQTHVGDVDDHELVATQPAFSDDEEAEGNTVHHVQGHDVEPLDAHAGLEHDGPRSSVQLGTQMLEAPTVEDVSGAKLENLAGGQDGAASPPQALQTTSSSVSTVDVEPDTNVSSPHHRHAQPLPKDDEHKLLELSTNDSQPDPSNVQSATSTLVDAGSTKEASPPEQQDHLPEPPASPFVSNSSASNHGESSTRPSGSTSDPKQPSTNRLSISYANGNRRLVIDAEVVHSIKIFRTEGRVEVSVTVDRVDDDDKNGLRGFLIEQLSDKSYIPVEILSTEHEIDSTLPPFSKLALPAELSLTVHLDTAKPLSEPKWVKSGDVQDWLKTMFGRMFWVAGEAAESGWEKRIEVMDPDPPPTLHTVMDGWANNSPVGQPTERHRFLKTHMAEIDNVLEILLRLVRGERATAFLQNAPTISGQSLTGPLLSALSPGSAHGGQQTHVSLAVLAIFRMASEYASKTDGDKGQTEAEERVSEIIRCLPTHLLYKSLDGMFKEWRVDKRGR